MTSDVDSESRWSMSTMCPQTHGHFKKMHQVNREKSPVLKDQMRFATETRLASSRTARDWSGVFSGRRSNALQAVHHTARTKGLRRTTVVRWHRGLLERRRGRILLRCKLAVAEIVLVVVV